MDNQDIMVVDVPYFGVKINNVSKHDLTVKVHGPLDSILINTIELRNTAIEMIDSIGTNNVTVLCNKLAQSLCDKYCDGIDILWVQVDLTTSSGILYGSSAEKVLV